MRSSGFPHITLAEDDPHELYFLSLTLRRLYPDASIAQFSNPEEALEHIENSGADLLITDHGMGPMSGTELIRHLRDRKCGIPIIMISGNPAARDEGLAAGANAFVQKNAKTAELERQLKRFLQEGSNP